MSSDRKDVAKKYILFREYKNKNRNDNKNYKLLDDNFITNYKHKPCPMKQLGEFVYYRTYSRYLPKEERREEWWETIRRAVEYNCSLVEGTTKEEAQQLFDNIYNLKQFLSGRTLWVGGTPVSQKYPLSNFNCSFSTIEKTNDLVELFYLLMLGCGVGVRILKEDIDKLPKLRIDYEIIHQDYNPILSYAREDLTSIRFKKQIATIVVGDSKTGWIEALRNYLDILIKNDYQHIDTIIFVYNNVRPSGERLKTFGGTASGHEALKNMISKIDKVLKNIKSKNNLIKLKPINVLDICDIIGETVVIGGVRRSAIITLFDSDDEECINAKTDLYKNIDGNWITNQELLHRQMSNNSIFYKEKPTREKLHWQLEKMRYSGEPGFLNKQTAELRRPNFKGGNPCMEILLDSKGVCNLTTVNVSSFVKDGVLDKENLLEAQKLSARAGYRMGLVELELPEWNNIQKRDRLIGCSLTGWQDMINELHMTKDEEIELLKELRIAAKNEIKDYSKMLGTKESLLVTSIKPEGSLSQLPRVSSGIHYSHSPYYIRRIRINTQDPLVKVCEELEYPIYPEVGQDYETCKTKVIEFPMKAPKGRTKYDVSALEQLENYKMFMKYYVDHNVSITVHVKNNEWNDVEKWLWNNWDDVVAVTFVSLDDNFYKLLPYEAISKEEYEKRVKVMKNFVPSLISKYENINDTFEIIDDECSTGSCPIR